MTLNVQRTLVLVALGASWSFSSATVSFSRRASSCPVMVAAVCDGAERWRTGRWEKERRQLNLWTTSIREDDDCRVIGAGVAWVNWGFVAGQPSGNRAGTKY